MAATTYPSVLIVTEKRETVYLLANSEADLHRHALDILRQRRNAGYYHAPDEPEPPIPYDDQVLAEMPAALQLGARRAQERARALRAAWEDAVRQLSDIARAVRDADGAAAWALLRSRSDCEYERVSLEPLQAEYLAGR